MAEFANPLTLPDEFALLLHKDNGSCYVGANPNTATAAAEIGELALRDRIELDGTAVRLVDAGWSGLPWMDRLLAEFQQWSGRDNRPIELAWWLPCRTGAFLTHRSVLVEQGLLRHERRKFLGVLPDDRYHPDPTTRAALLAELREVAGDARQVDARLALLAALVHHSGLVYLLEFDRAQRGGLKAIAEREDLGDAVGTAVAAMLAAITAIPAIIVVAGG
ncbi:GPP34 family phosphoprotein [Saccharopolyspora sp. K220]|uniref:GOLPH3/VPS74 family protein n=1 Tax=Saccharopolyspora soli TaxID=2926618 RepID=UPI001F5A0057|nr:GPP34 family phosphoprotein [Saccharopolyspora soli]MCI2418949.1 GPP34 family phosphoprotein [Saccharopolyspora soli]